MLGEEVEEFSWGREEIDKEQIQLLSDIPQPQYWGIVLIQAPPLCEPGALPTDDGMVVLTEDLSPGDNLSSASLC